VFGSARPSSVPPPHYYNTRLSGPRSNNILFSYIWAYFEKTTYVAELDLLPLLQALYKRPVLGKTENLCGRAAVGYSSAA